MNTLPRQLSASEYQQIFAHGTKAEYVPAALITALQNAGSIAADVASPHSSFRLTGITIFRSE
jgi:hypothetical protein